MTVRVYTVGLVYASCCAPADMEPAAVAAEVNAQHPTGIDSRWTIEAETFASGAPNPSPCHDDAARRHWLLSC